MMAEVSLLNDRPPTVAVGASNLALRHLAFQRGDRVLGVRQPNDRVFLDTDVVEVENDRVALATVDATRRLQVVHDEEQVVRPSLGRNPPPTIEPRTYVHGPVV
jgi:hypothetical protein